MQFFVVIFWMQISDNFKSMKSHSGKQTCKWHTTERALKAGALVLTTCGSTAKVVYVPSVLMGQLVKIFMFLGLLSKGSRSRYFINISPFLLAFQASVLVLRCLILFLEVKYK